MSLEVYNKKRNFKETTEPEGKKERPRTPAARKLIFVIHEHHASHLHWDLRLEMSGALASWAVPKTPEELKEKGTKRLAMHVEDHPLSYATFKGIIPEGNYGAGSVEIWDSGFYELKSSDSKKIEFTLHGKKLKGDYVLVKTTYGSRSDKSWLWFKV